MEHKNCLLTTLYLPSVAVMRSIAHYSDLMIDGVEHYQKQSFRNRAHIVGANGIQALTIPIVNGHSLGIRIKDAKIAYDTRWQQVHWRSIVSAYKSSPFFEYYEDEFAPFYHSRYVFLFDYNRDLLAIILKLIDFSTSKQVVDFTTFDCEFDDLRSFAESKKEADVYLQTPYWQVFQNRLGFTANLSVLDLLFNLGPESYLYLENWSKNIKRD